MATNVLNTPRKLLNINLTNICTDISCTSCITVAQPWLGRQERGTRWKHSFIPDRDGSNLGSFPVFFFQSLHESPSVPLSKKLWSPPSKSLTTYYLWLPDQSISFTFFTISVKTLSFRSVFIYAVKRPPLQSYQPKLCRDSCQNAKNKLTVRKRHKKSHFTTAWHKHRAS